MPKDQKGQSAVEFVLIAPILFLIFFGIIQLFYCAYVSFAVQKATFAIAQQAASTEIPTFFQSQFQIVSALFPLEKLNNSTLLYALSSKCNIQEQNNRVIATVSYPMPIWIPLVGKVLGQPLSTSTSPLSFVSQDLSSLLSTLGLSLPSFLNLSSTNNVIWMTFQADCLDENTVGVHS